MFTPFFGRRCRDLKLLVFASKAKCAFTTPKEFETVSSQNAQGASTSFLGGGVILDIESQSLNPGQDTLANQKRNGRTTDGETTLELLS